MTEAPMSSLNNFFMLLKEVCYAHQGCIYLM